jgi:glycosyltransferase involved in cell wall biosynthesis
LSIAKVVQGIPFYVNTIILVNDASTDCTGEIIESLADSRIHVFHQEKNSGVGGATIRGYQEALNLGVDIIVKMDGDGQMDPACLPVLIGPILSGKADYTKGNRFLHSNEINRMPFLRRIGNIGLSFLTKLASGYWNIFDPTNGYTAIRSKVVEKMDLLSLSPRYFFESSLLIELGMQRAMVVDVYIPAVYGNETSHLSEYKTLLDFPPRLLKAFLRRILIQYYIRDFSMVSLYLIFGFLAVGFGGVWGVAQWSISAARGVPASTGTVMLAVLPIILGIQLLLQAIVIDIQNVPDESICGEESALFQLLENIKEIEE